MPRRLVVGLADDEVEALKAGLNIIKQGGPGRLIKQVRLTARRNGSLHREHIRLQLWATPVEEANRRLTSAALSLIMGQEVSKAMTIRYALRLAAKEALAGLTAPKVAKRVKAELMAARDEKALDD